MSIAICKSNQSQAPAAHFALKLGQVQKGLLEWHISKGQDKSGAALASYGPRPCQADEA